MNAEMAYLLGMICGNGEIQRGKTETTILVEIPHKKLETDGFSNIDVYVKASMEDIRKNLALISAGINFTQNKSVAMLSFSKTNTDYLIREILKLIGNATSHDNMRIHSDVFDFTQDEKTSFLGGLADVTGYIRKSNRYRGLLGQHRVYIEVPNNWELVVDLCNLLKSINIPVQTIDWAHPNMRDSNVRKYNAGYKNFWKKEHQIKIWANEFLPIGFRILHKQQALENYAQELLRTKLKTHRYYWESKQKNKKVKPSHPCENDVAIPVKIRGKHYNSWKEIAEELGYDKES
jgi:hypothetical protein